MKAITRPIADNRSESRQIAKDVSTDAGQNEKVEPQITLLKEKSRVIEQAKPIVGALPTANVISETDGLAA